jgi:hypothetical protein
MAVAGGSGPISTTEDEAVSITIETVRYSIAVRDGGVEGYTQVGVRQLGAIGLGLADDRAFKPVNRYVHRGRTPIGRLSSGGDSVVAWLSSFMPIFAARGSSALT